MATIEDWRGHWRILLFLLTPIALAPIPIAFQSQESKCGYVVLVMAVYWMSEVLPLAVTAFLPLFLFPALGILPAKQVAPNYLKDSNFVFVGSLIAAVAVEHSRLHERIALRILLLMGSNPRWLMLGFQLATAFLSMWMSNTATTAMVLPIVLAVIMELERFGQKSTENGKDCVQMAEMNAKEEQEKEKTFSLDVKAVPPGRLRVYKAMLLSICYSANVGGTATLIGTGSNIVLSGQMQQIYGNTSISFASWMLFALPPMILYLLICWLWLQAIFIGFRQKIESNPGVGIMLRTKYVNLGPMRFNEKAVLILFCILVALFLLRDPKVFSGWGSLFEAGYMSDGSAAMFVGTLMFVMPAENPLRVPGASPLLTWDVMQRRFSWSTVMLLGGGYAMAAGVTASGLSDLVGHRLALLTQLPNWIFIAITVTAVTFLTEFTSNVATATIFIPMIAGVADQAHVNPLYFVIPITVACSFAFMLPVATPPNAIVFSARILRVTDMMKAGLFMNFACIILTVLIAHTWAWWLYDYGSVPDWAVKNVTAV